VCPTNLNLLNHIREKNEVNKVKGLCGNIIATGVVLFVKLGKNEGFYPVKFAIYDL
jgi:hypothetical protein